MKDGELSMTRMALQVSGTQDFHPVHHDPAVARSGGHPDTFLNAAFIRGCLCRLLTDRAGRKGFVAALGFQMPRPNGLGETIAARGRAAARRPESRVAPEVWIDNAPDDVTVPGTPSRTASSGAGAATPARYGTVTVGMVSL